MDTLHIGQIIKEPQLQDAIHIAVAPVVAYRTLRPGEHVGLLEDGKADFCIEKPIGIVDPFLANPVKKGETFWLFLYPGSITSLKHFWTHPAFDKKPEPVIAPPIPVVLPNQPPAPKAVTITVVPEEDIAIKEAMEAVSEIADDKGLEVNELLDAADNYVKYGEYLCEGGRWEGEYLEKDFWDHYEIIRKVKVPANKRYSFFSCSC